MLTKSKLRDRVADKPPANIPLSKWAKIKAVFKRTFPNKWFNILMAAGIGIRLLVAHHDATVGRKLAADKKWVQQL